MLSGTKRLYPAPLATPFRGGGDFELNDILTVSKILGHCNIQVTQSYINPSAVNIFGGWRGITTGGSVDNMSVRIEVKKTGKHLKKLTEDAGYSAKDLQKYLGLSCPQPVYRWFKGKMLPSVDHLIALGILLRKHVDELIILEPDAKNIEFDIIRFPEREKLILRLEAYRIRLQKMCGVVSKISAECVNSVSP